ncbi:hypothetical protein GY45DRAFT_202951 [Cubamyces sp. BRFM 1775]|nr:hypothetical protein GY45DRAFT_202951 [Cubamyces sp. BRFM 1775]
MSPCRMTWRSRQGQDGVGTQRRIARQSSAHNDPRGQLLRVHKPSAEQCHRMPQRSPPAALSLRLAVGLGPGRPRSPTLTLSGRYLATASNGQLTFSEGSALKIELYSNGERHGASERNELNYGMCTSQLTGVTGLTICIGTFAERASPSR